MTEQELDLKHWLNRAFYADKKAKALDMLVAQCRERATGLVRASEGNDAGRSGTTKNGTENALIQLAEMENDEKTSVFLNRMADFFRYNVKKGSKQLTSMVEHLTTHAAQNVIQAGYFTRWMRLVGLLIT